MGVVNSFTRGFDEALSFYKKAGSAFLENGLTSAKKSMSKSWNGGYVKDLAGNMGRVRQKGMTKTGKFITGASGMYGANRALDEAGIDIPLVPFL